jgi:DNA polymerase I-like protein with 3'-5' exonuclease and polymerase domains
VAQGILTLDQLEVLVDDYMQFEEYVFDVETMGEHRDDPYRNEVFWISLAGPGRADAIPCGHPVGERVEYDPDDDTHRIAKNGHYQEHRINETSGRLKWFDIPAQFTPAPPQLWVSDVMETLRPLLFSKKKRKIGQNVRFDLESVAKYYNALPPPPYGDIIVAAKLVNENHFGYKLGEMVKREFHFEYEKIGKAGPEKFPYSEAYMYSYYDAKYEWLLWEKYGPLLEKENVAHIFDIEMDVLEVILDMERAGITLDEERLAELGVIFSKEMARLMIDIEKANEGPINLNANEQVADLVYEKRKHPCKVFTPSGKRSTASDTLESFHKDPIVKKIGEYAKFSKLQSSFVINLQNRVFENKIHPSVNQVGARTGRSSVSEPNIQQIPVRSEDGKRVREVFVASPGHLLIVSDLSQIELRVLGHFTQDKQLLRAYRNNLDLHALLAARVFGEDFTPIDRLYAKNGNFSVLFGAAAPTLVRRYGFPNVRLAQQVIDGFYATYRRVEPWKEEILDTARRKYRKGVSPPYVSTILGRKRRLPELNSSVRGVRAGAERQAVSSIIQGSAADLFKLAMIDCHELLQKQAWEGHIIMTVHDELVVEVPERYAKEGLVLVKSAMESVVNPFTEEPILSLPVVADAKIVERWSDAK